MNVKSTGHNQTLPEVTAAGELNEALRICRSGNKMIRKTITKNRYTKPMNIRSVTDSFILVPPKVIASYHKLLEDIFLATKFTIISSVKLITELNNPIAVEKLKFAPSRPTL